MSTSVENWPRPTESHRVVHADEDLVVAFKPSHLLVHRTDVATPDTDNLRDRLIAEGVLDHGAHPVNRIDRPTSGLVLFSRHLDAHRFLQAQFAEHRIEKRYVAVVRGWLEGPESAEKPLPTGHNSIPKPARTHFRPLALAEWDVAITRYPTSRFSLVECIPETGRYHQIRLHLRHLRHPIIGDTAHGDKPHNRFFAARFMHRPLYLHAGELQLTHPNGTQHRFLAPLPPSWDEVMVEFGWSGQTPFLRG